MSAGENKPLGFDAEPVTSEPLKDTDGKLSCPVHFCHMVMYSGKKSSGGKSYYRCKVDECKETGNKFVEKVEHVIPKEPTRCPRCRETYMIVDNDRNKNGMIYLRCTTCDYVSEPKMSPAVYLQFDSQQRNRKSK